MLFHVIQLKHSIFIQRGDVTSIRDIDIVNHTSSIKWELKLSGFSMVCFIANMMVIKTFPTNLKNSVGVYYRWSTVQCAELQIVCIFLLFDASQRCLYALRYIFEIILKTTISSTQWCCVLHRSVVTCTPTSDADCKRNGKIMIFFLMK